MGTRSGASLRSSREKISAKRSRRSGHSGKGAIKTTLRTRGNPVALGDAYRRSAQRTAVMLRVQRPPGLCWVVMKDPHLRRRRRSRGPLPLGGARLLGLSLALAPLAARAAPCSPVVNLLGDPGLVTRVGQALRQRGISLGQGAPGCPVLRASVSATSDDTPRLRVTTIEEVQRTEHVVVDSGTAATLIESWARRSTSGPRAVTMMEFTWLLGMRLIPARNELIGMTTVSSLS